MLLGRILQMSQNMHLDFWARMLVLLTGSNDQHQCCFAPNNFSDWYKWLLSNNEHRQHTESNSMALKMEAQVPPDRTNLYSYKV